MARKKLIVASSTDSVATMTARVEPSGSPIRLRYRTRTGALLRVDGAVAGAFDRQHREIELAPSPEARELSLEVDLHAMPSTGLPPGPGVRWSWTLRNASQQPGRTIELEPVARDGEPPKLPPDAQTLWGHSHLDVAWLWTYGDTRRKAMRTFANAVELLEEFPEFVFMQSQPQLYEFVSQEDPAFFERVRSLARERRFDPSVAALWVEPDCNVPSGESLLRQMLFAHRYCVENFGVEPSVAWLPDTFGFARTLPTLLRHAGIKYFATTKLQWNDTTKFPYAQFRWRGPDGSEVVAASMFSMEGGFDPVRPVVAKRRNEPLIVGYGDGGGGPTRSHLETARTRGTWERPEAWFERLDRRAADLPVYDDELYLEYHRGVYTTHHDVKAFNARLERRLEAAEERAAWCVAVRVAPQALERVRIALHDAWKIVLRNQFHDVLPGTSIAPVYADALEEYARAEELVDRAEMALRAMLPRGSAAVRQDALCAPVERDGGFAFSNDAIEAHVLPSGALVELAARGRTDLVAQANLLATYRDRPKKWEAWNIDAGYDRRRFAARPQEPEISDGALLVPFDIGSSGATMRVSLARDEAFLRVELTVDWQERRRLLRVENYLATTATDVRYGAPHGSVVRSAATDTPERRARFEVPGQRFAMVADGRGGGLAMLSADAYGWSARVLARGGMQLGHSLLRGTCWPDPEADRGEHQLAWAYAPLRDARASAVERLWQQYASEARVRLFTSDDDAVSIATCKPAEDGDGVVVRVRECDGLARTARLRCGGRMRAVVPVDALERQIGGDARVEGETIVAELGPYALRAFRVTF